ncbi:MOSC domain-containing protein [Olleya sp. HaHaR_3_96]|uniref:MOSC domain-containing protein n=1 Tax=Olleya sp. HaHaR_3_96 TaxID=2745560 RepID=UPI001C4F3E17|nr:MOSC domain-containing protein [Olleya sp. HaHaR_3_96]QXP61529.1 MOSC domain-containing protein [Olleya sp. HaHaR_3_96]
MKITSTNIAKPTTIEWNGKKQTTGMYKNPTDAGIYLEKEDVKGDEVSDRKHHGGIFKACYLFSEDHYDYWKNLYPNIAFNYGVFGENLTVKGLDETKIRVGDIYKIGTALVQVTQPREPCFKLGIRFGTQTILKQFINHARPGTYIRILEEGLVKPGDHMLLVQAATNSLTTAQLFTLLFSKQKDQSQLALIIDNDAIPLKKRQKLAAFIKN